MTDNKRPFKVSVPPRNHFHMTDWWDVQDFETIEEAVAFAKKVYGADDQGMVSLIKEKDE